MLPNKLPLLEDIITKILKQTVECSIFIREYTGQGFGGEHQATGTHASLLTYSTARMVKWTVTNTSQTIENLTNNLISLKWSFDGGGNIQAIVVSARTLDGIEKLGMNYASISHS